jgi:hypothetical protein
MFRLKKLIYKLFNLILRRVSIKIEIFLLRIFNFQNKYHEPIKCQYCGSKNLYDEITDYMDYTLMEYDRICGQCDKILGTWVTGHWSL